MENEFDFSVMVYKFFSLSNFSKLSPPYILWSRTLKNSKKFVLVKTLTTRLGRERKWNDTSKRFIYIKPGYENEKSFKKVKKKKGKRKIGDIGGILKTKKNCFSSFFSFEVI